MMPHVQSMALSSYHTARQQKPEWEFLNKQEVTAPTPDSVEISPEALEKHELMKMADTFSIIYRDGAQRDTKTLGEVAADLEENLAEYTGLLGTFFRQAGIDTSSRELELKPDFEGSIVTANKHPDSAKVDKLFAGDSTLTARFMVIAARSSLLHAAETNPEFKAAYERDARSAIKDHIGTLRETLFGFRMKVNDGELSTDFVSP